MKDKKKFKLITTVIALVVLVVWMAVWFMSQNKGLEEGGPFDSVKVEEEMKNVISLLDAEDYDALQEISDDAMKEVLTTEVWGEAKMQISENWGVLEKLGEVSMSQAEQDGVQFAACQVKATYENVKVNYMIVFNQDMKLAGLYVE